MKRIHRSAVVVVFLALALILVSCNTPTQVVQPTQDVPSIRTESAQTVVAKITIDAALNPTATTAGAVEATNTPQALPATATTAPTATSAEPTATLIPTFTPMATMRPASANPLPTITRRPGPNQADMVSQTPADGTVFNAGESFDMVVQFKNIGTSTWNTNYRIKAADNSNTTIMSPQTRYYLKTETKPGDTAKFIADMVAPSDHGRHVMYWELADDNNAVFYAFYIVIDTK